MKDIRGRVCRHVEHRYCRAINRETPAELPPVHPRHDHIGDHERKMGGQMRQVERLPAVSSLQYAVALIPQKPDHQPAQEILVLCDEDGDRTLGYRMRLSHNRPWLGLFKGIADAPTVAARSRPRGRPNGAASGWANSLPSKDSWPIGLPQGTTGSGLEEYSNRDVA
jgi:hypothetical protein